MSLTVTFSAYSEASPEDLWDVLANIDAWPTWDSRLVSTTSSGGVKAGATYKLKPHDGHEVSITIKEADGRSFKDEARLEFGVIETDRSVEACGEGSMVTQTMRANIDEGAVRTFANVFWDSWSQGIIDSTRELAQAPQRQGFVASHRNVA